MWHTWVSCQKEKKCDYEHTWIGEDFKQVESTKIIPKTNSTQDEI